jgi:hypothetical protein
LNRSLALAFVLAATPALAQQLGTNPFSDGEDGAKIHMASGYVCPAKIGGFERDAVGISDIDKGTDFCAYSALDGVYGTIKLTPLTGPYDPKASLQPEFEEQEKTVGKLVDEKTVKVKGTDVPVYTRTYQTASLEELRYYAEFTGAAIGNWAVEATIEYASPRNDPQAQTFLEAVYSGAQAKIAAK